MKRLVPIALLASLAVTTAPIAGTIGDSGRAVRRAAEPVIEQFLIAANQDAFKLASRDFSPELARALPEAELAATIAGLERDHGAFVEHGYLGSLATAGRTRSMVLWKLEYERSDVLLQVMMERRDGRVLLTGLRFH